MKNIATWKLIAKSLEDKVAVMLLYVLESSGSSPGRQGFFMCVNANGAMEGSIGGGIMEHKFVEMARRSLETGVRGREFEDAAIRKQFHDKAAVKDQSGMICSGEQTILLYRIQDKDAGVIRNIIVSLEKYENGTLTLLPGNILFDNAVPEKDFEYIFQSEEDWIYKEKTGYKNQIFVIGGGHCALAFSKLMRSMDFYIRVYDDRKDLKTMLENDSAHENHFINSYSELEALISPGNNNYIVVMTFGYRTDDIAVRALLNRDFKYFGLLGSKKKIEKMFEDYMKEGVSKERLQRIHTPIGLAIKSQTPEEIAVSIAAEIIQVKNADLG